MFGIDGAGMRYFLLATLVMFVGCGRKQQTNKKLDLSQLCTMIDANIASDKKMAKKSPNSRFRSEFNRAYLEGLERIAAADPSVLAPAGSAADARKIAARGDNPWLVVEHQGRWYVLANQGHPAADGFFEVVVIDKETKQVIGRVVDCVPSQQEQVDLVQESDSALSTTISRSSVQEFLRFAAGKKFSEFAEVYARATALYVPGRVVEGYPDVFPDRYDARHRVSHRLKAQGVDPETVAAIVLFDGGDGILAHDVVLVLKSKDSRVVAVYHVAWGR